MLEDELEFSDDPLSPCVGICIIDTRTHLCDGCHRTLDEIATWSEYTSAQKQAVIYDLRYR
jgi:predicted Fe-S protein YdhL (DUF1289 family)